MVKATKVEGYDGKEVDDAERQWSVSGSLLYSITVITTIGHCTLLIVSIIAMAIGASGFHPSFILQLFIEFTRTFYSF